MTLPDRRAALKQLGGALACLSLPAPSRTAEKRDVSWLAEVQRPPKKRPAGPALERLLVGEDGAPLRTLAQWQARRDALRKRWLAFLGPMPAPPAVKLTVLAEDRP